VRRREENREEIIIDIHGPSWRMKESKKLKRFVQKESCANLLRKEPNEGEDTKCKNTLDI
jgi:hypothetical protein